jgi:hypothetical protein
MGKLNDDQFFNVLKGSYSSPEDMNEDEDYIESMVECDNCGDDTHMNDAVVATPTSKERAAGAVTNYYCGEECARSHQSGARKGRIGNPFGE